MNAPPFALGGGELAAAVRNYLGNDLYATPREWCMTGNPYRRPMAIGEFDEADFDRVLPVEDVASAGGLAAQRMLTNLYEADLVFLPPGDLTAVWPDFRSFYSGGNRARGELVRPALERYAFGFLDEEVAVTGRWDAEALFGYLRALEERDLSGPTLAQRAIERSADPARAARMWLIQFAPDFLSEASPMIRNLTGHFGPAQSEWFKIIIDEYGYGVHETKHSTLYEDTLRSAGLSTEVHYYWAHYLAGSLLVNNYFHYLGKNHELVFRYLGALYYTETSLVEFCRTAAAMLGRVLPGADVTYFTEHVHIDTHHGRMALEKLIMPVVETCGAVVIPDVVRGFEEYQVIADAADRDFVAQLDFMDGVTGGRDAGARAWASVGERSVPRTRTLTGPAVLESAARDEDVLYRVTAGKLRLMRGFGSELVLRAGDCALVPRHRLHGGVVEDGVCTVDVHVLGGDQAACSS